MIARARWVLVLVSSTVLAVSLLVAGPAQAADDAVQNTSAPWISGTPAYGRQLTGHIGSWAGAIDRRDYRWLRNGTPITGATGRHYTVRSADVGTAISFRVTARRAGWPRVTAISKARTVDVRRVRKTVTYSVTTRGAVSASVSTFRRQAQETYDDPRGWRAMGVRFKRVSKGGDFTLVLSKASAVPSFSSACSTTYSCRVGRYVVINETRWRQASPAWKSNGGSLRDYRHLVVNHETGHWFGRGHVGCGGKGQSAPVMQQQSKGLGGCTINPWPRKNELHAPRYGW